MNSEKPRRTSPVQFLLILSASIIFASCSREQVDKQSQSTGREIPSSSKVLNVLTWEDYVAPEVLEGFTERTGIEVTLSTFENSEELIGELRAASDKHDVVIFDNSSVPRLADIQLLRELDHSALPGMRNLDRKFVDLATDKGNRFSIPYHWGSTLVAYRKDKIENPEHSFQLLFDESLKGKVLMLDDPFEYFAVAHLMEGRSINSFDREDLISAAELLKDQVRKNGAQQASDAAIKEALASGSCWAAMCYSGDAAWIAEDHPEVGYFFPKEGAALWLDIMSISRDAPNVENAYKFIDYLLEPEVIATNSNELWYANPNKNAESLLSEELLEDEALFPPKEVLEACEFHAISPNDINNLISQLVREIHAERKANVARVNPITRPWPQR